MVQNNIFLVIFYKTVVKIKTTIFFVTKVIDDALTENMFPRMSISLAFFYIFFAHEL